MIKKNKKNLNILAIIPARGGSKRIPKKNIKLLAGKPLIAYTIRAAKNSRYINRIVVSTDNQEIANVSKKYGAEVIDRPAELAGDKVLVQLAINHALLVLKEKEQYMPDVLILLQPTSPLRDVRHIDESIEVFLKGGHNSLLSVCKSKSFLWRTKNGTNEPINYDINKRPMAQDKSLEYRENGAIYVADYATILTVPNVLGGKIGLYVMPEEDSIDIDNEFDFYLVEQLLKRKLS